MTGILSTLTNANEGVRSILLGAVGVALAGAIVAVVTAVVNRKSNDETSAGTLASGAADLIGQSLSLLQVTNESASKLAATLEAERDACHEDRLILLSMVEGAAIDDRELAALRARIRITAPSSIHLDPPA